jgi:DNA-binding transcriptional LysR family regulator
MMNNSGMNEQKINELWSHLHWLTVLAQQGSFTAAAARLGVSKAAMSQHMTELERMAGVALVRRTTRSVQLTEAGQRLVDDTRAPFEHIARSFAEVRDLAGAPRGLLRVTAPVALARQQLVPRLADFLREYPEVRLELDMSDRLSSMTTEGFDLAIRHTAAPPDTHVAWTLCATRSVLVASRSYLRRSGSPNAPADLIKHITHARMTRRSGLSSPSTPQRPLTSRRNGSQCRSPARCPPTTARPCVMPRSPVWASRCCPISAPRPACRQANWRRCCRSGNLSVLLPNNSMPSGPIRPTYRAP